MESSGSTDLRAEALRNAMQAEVEGERNFSAARTNRVIHYVIGLATVAAGAFAAYFAQSDSIETARVAALVATLLAAAQAFLDEGRRANSQYARAAALLGVEKRFRAFAVAAEEPASRQERFDEIVARWEQVQAPSLE